MKVTVADTGIGIKAEDREMIFERYRTDKARSGWAAVAWRALPVGLHRRTMAITVESTVGVGSTLHSGCPNIKKPPQHTDLQPVADQ